MKKESVSQSQNTQDNDNASDTAGVEFDSEKIHSEIKESTCKTTKEVEDRLNKIQQDILEQSKS